VCLSDDVPAAQARRLFCGHAFCCDCVAQLIASAVASGLPDAEGVRCPELSCRAPLTGADVDAGAADGATAARFHALALDRLIARSTGDGLGCCPTPGCSFAFAWDADHRKLSCPLCHKRYCLVCKCDWHAGVRCEARAAAAGGGAGGADDDGLAALAAKGKWKACPNCSVWVARETGCDAMRCLCGAKFCYKCGARTGTGAGGLGDCRCADANTRAVHAVHADDRDPPVMPPLAAAVAQAAGAAGAALAAGLFAAFGAGRGRGRGRRGR
jgi:ariadne-1